MAGNSGRYKGRRNSGNGRRYRARESERTQMLNLNSIPLFRYEIKEIMSNYDIDEAIASSVIASVVVKGSRISIDSAKNFVRGQEKIGSYPKEASDEICYLLDRFSRHR